MEWLGLACRVGMGERRVFGVFTSRLFVFWVNIERRYLRFVVGGVWAGIDCFRLPGYGGLLIACSIGDADLGLRATACLLVWKIQ